MFLTPGSFDKGGVSRYTRYQITALREMFDQHDVRVYSVWGRQPDDFETPFEVDWSAGGISATQKLAFMSKTAVDAVRFRPQVILAAHVNLSGLAVTLAKTVRARSVLNVYGREIWSGLRRDAAWGLRSSDLVISDCHFTKRYIEEEGRLRSLGASTRVLWDCVDTERFKPGRSSDAVLKRYGIPDPTTFVNVLTLGRMKPEAAHKGYDRLLEAFTRAAQQAPMLRLIYAGSGDLIPELQRRAHSAGVADRVVFSGTVSEEDLADLYRSCQVFSLVSDRGPGRGEGIPLSPLEAASCEKPILVGNHDGSQEAVVEGANGFVLDPFDIETHADRLVRLASDADLRGAMGRAARKRILEFHDYQTFREQMGTFMRDLV
jgi:phosphatidylinositol alpha-1,6-mannosyltransferase